MVERNASEAPADDWRVGPSDIAQAQVRVGIVSGVAMWSWVRTGRPAPAAFDDYDYLMLPLAYLACAVALLLWSWLLDLRGSTGIVLGARRVCGVIADVAALSGYTALGGHHALIVFPFFLTVIIGYGYRFGLGYLYLAIATSLVGFDLAHPHNPAFAGESALVWSYHLSLVLVPGYAALLLRRHQAVLIRLREVLEARSRFIANISHELRTPLHTIISSAHAALECGGHEPLRQDTALRLVVDAARHLLGLVNRILDVAAARAGSLRLATGPADLYAIVSATVDICRPQATEKGVACHWRVDPEVPRHVVTAGPQVQEVLINLLGNALKFTSEGHALLHVTTRGDATGEDRLVFRIADTGPGIAANLLPRLFQPFTLGDAGRARTQGGTGLGLTISKDYVEALGGRMALFSREGTGTECEVELPLHAVADGDLGPPARPIACVVLAPSALSPSEHGAFAGAGFAPQWTTLESWRERPAPPPAVMFVHRAYLSAPELATGTLVRADGGTLLIAYAVDRAAAATLPLPFQSHAGIAAIGELLAIRELVASRAAQEAARIEPATRPLRVLIVDDNLTNLLAAGHALRAAGHTVDCAASADEALRSASNRLYDVALVDLHLPGRNGLEIVTALGQLGPTACAILTADVTAGARDAALAAGAADVITKPIAPKDLRAAVARLGARDDIGLIGTLFAEVISDVPPGPAVERLIDAFAEEGRSLLAEIAAATDADPGRVRRTLHRLKACAATMGADVLLAEVSAMEDAYLDPPGMPRSRAALALLLERTIAAMRAAARAPTDAPARHGLADGRRTI